MDSSKQVTDKRLLFVQVDYREQNDGSGDSGLGASLPSPTTEESPPFEKNDHNIDSSTQETDEGLLYVKGNYTVQSDGIADSGLGASSLTTEVAAPCGDFSKLTLEDSCKYQDDKNTEGQSIVQDVDTQRSSYRNDEVNDQNETHGTLVKVDPVTEVLQYIFQQDESGDTYLHLYICKNDILAVRGILTYKPLLEDINKQNDCQQTALHLATCVESAEALELLLRYGANPELVDDQGNNIWHIAAEKENPFILRVLCTLYTKEDILTSSVRNSLRTTLHRKNYEGRSPIHTAVRFNRKRAVEMLLQVGADVDDKDYGFEYTPLHYAAKMGDATLVAHLVHVRSADVTSQALNGVTPLHLATSYDHPAIVSILLGAGADVDVVTYEGDSARCFARSDEVLNIIHQFDHLASTVHS